MNKSKKTIISVIAMLISISILMVSAIAAYDSANGYTELKNSLKNLVLKTENFTANGVGTLTYNGDQLASIELEAKYNGRSNF